ncbi:MAG: type II 3-dehydroquinate dehydratase [Rubellimicrobium sp.]|nr:type II 3-dehydroquinate dehydratase [Rubellimicrobium sp.]
MPTILVLNGPNLNLLGLRQPEIYGHATLADVEALCQRTARGAGLAADCRQTNHEGVMIDWIHAARGTASGILINPGGWSHTSVALLDALNAYEAPVVEVHISNIHRREAFRHHSHISARAEAVIAGCGVQGYALGLLHLAERLGAAGA